MATADESLAGGGISGYGTRREDEAGRQGLRLGGGGEGYGFGRAGRLERKRMVERNNCSGGTFLRSTVMVLIPKSGPTYM